jgi:hypothetical protein
VDSVISFLSAVWSYVALPISLFVLYIVFEIYRTIFLTAGKSARIQLVAGSVIDPYNHPSYSSKKVKTLKEARQNFDDRLAALKDEYPEIAGTI